MSEGIQLELAGSNMKRSFFDAFLSAVSNGEPFPLEGRENITSWPLPKHRL